MPATSPASAPDTSATAVADTTGPIPSGAPGQAVNTSDPTRVIGNGQPSSCTSAAVVNAVAAGGIITFACGSKPLTITMSATAIVPNTDHLVVLDGGGLITLSGAGERQILFSDTCQGTWSTDDCVDQQYPQIVVQNISFEDGYSGAQQSLSCTQSAVSCWYGGVDGGGAVYVEGGQFTAVHSIFAGNSCYASGPDLGGGAIRALAQWNDQPVYITDDTFTANSCSNGGALSSINVGWDITGSTFTGNSAIGWGANPAASGTPGGGSGGAIYLDGTDDDTQISDSVMSANTAREGGGALFDVVDTGSASLTFDGSQLTGNTSAVFQTAPGIYYVVDGKDAVPTLVDSTDD